MIAVVSPATRTVVDRIDVGQAPTDVAYDGTNIWVADTGGSSVHKLVPR